ncbi:MAG: carboxypeptidase-like regulatory domain-containing protein, partial [Promethearchaeota archaeon]
PIKFIQTGLDISALGELVVTVDDPISLNYEALPYVMMVRNTAVVTYEFEDFVASSDLGKQFRLVDPVGQNSITITEPTTLTGTYVTQYEITFDQVGLDGTANGELVVTFDSTTKNTENLPYTTWFDAGDEISYTYSNPVLSSVIDKQFWLTSVDGPGSPFIVTEPLTIIGNYLALPLSKITTSDLCYFDINDDLEGQQFRLIFTQNPLDPSHSTYKLTASNPGQFYYNVFFAGTPGSEAPLTINIPYPFETQGANPIHIYSYVSIGPEGCFIPSNEISCNFVIEILSDNGLEISIDGNVPESGLIYVTIHLDYGLKKEVGFIKDAYDNAINQGIDTENDFDDLYIYNYENYQFSYSFYNMPIDDEVIQNINVFKHDPGFAGLVLDGSNTPIANVKVEIYDPDNNLLTTLFTDDDGFYFFHYKHTGKGAMYVVKLPDYNVEQEVYVKANKFVEVNFQI